MAEHHVECFYGVKASADKPKPKEQQKDNATSKASAKEPKKNLAQEEEKP
jgi:hypothetical protein